MSTEALFTRFYYSKPGWLGGTRTFHQLCRDSAPPNANILEIGAGPSNDTSAFLATLGLLSGLDIADDVLENRYLASAKTFDGNLFPYADESFDLCVSDWVLEHVESPALHFTEVARILRPGGSYCFRTMNLWHYVSLASRLLPYSMHLLLSSKLRRMPEGAHDPYRTFYRANTPRRLRGLAQKAGMVVKQIHLMEPEPSYGRAHALLFYPMMTYERVVNSLELLSFMRVTIFCVLKKPI